MPFTNSGRKFEEYVYSYFKYNKDDWENLTPYIDGVHKKFSSYIKNNYKYDVKKILSKEINPDFVFYNKKNKQIRVFEAKYIAPINSNGKKNSGSVDEKLQTAPYKLKQLKKVFNNFFKTEDIKYIYILNKEFWDRKEYKDTYDYLNEYEELDYILFDDTEILF